MGGTSLAMRARQLILERDRWAQRAGRAPQSIRLLAVSKGHEAHQVRQAAALGLYLFGENYVQEWLEKRELLSGLPLEWHFIGQLQSNKAKAVVGQVALIHALDRDSLAQAISTQAEQSQVTQKVLVAVNLADEPGKSGLSLREGPQWLRTWAKLPGLRLAGLMVMPPPVVNPELSRPYFRQARELLETWRNEVGEHPWNELSMGTSQDFGVAIEEGATLVRVGTALFGERPIKE